MAGRLKRRSSIGLSRDRRDSIGPSTTNGTPIGKDRQLLTDDGLLLHTDMGLNDWHGWHGLLMY